MPEYHKWMEREINLSEIKSKRIEMKPIRERLRRLRYFYNWLKRFKMGKGIR